MAFRAVWPDAAAYPPTATKHAAAASADRRERVMRLAYAKLERNRPTTTLLRKNGWPMVGGGPLCLVMLAPSSVVSQNTGTQADIGVHFPARCRPDRGERVPQTHDRPGLTRDATGVERSGRRRTGGGRAVARQRRGAAGPRILLSCRLPADRASRAGTSCSCSVGCTASCASFVWKSGHGRAHTVSARS